VVSVLSVDYPLMGFLYLLLKTVIDVLDQPGIG
jgi:hypothetical protein